MFGEKRHGLPSLLLVRDPHVERVAVQDAVEGIYLIEAFAALTVVRPVDQPDGEAIVALRRAFTGAREGVLVALQPAACCSRPTPFCPR